MFELVENRLYAYAVITHYWQLSQRQQTYLLLLPPLTSTWLGFRSGAITGTILNPNKIKALVVNRSRTVNPPQETWSTCMGFPSLLVSTSISLAWSSTSSSHLKTMCVVLFAVSLKELVFWGWWNSYLYALRCYLHLFFRTLSIVLCLGGLSAAERHLQPVPNLWGEGLGAIAPGPPGQGAQLNVCNLQVWTVTYRAQSAYNTHWRYCHLIC